MEHHVAADEFDAVDVELLGWDGGVDGLAGVGGEIAREGFAGESLPGEGEVELGIAGFLGEILVDAVFLDGELEIHESGEGGGEAGLFPTGGGEFVDEFGFEVVGGVEAGVVAGEVSVVGVGVVVLDEDVNLGGVAVGEGVFGGDGFTFGRGGAMGFGAVEDGLGGALVFFCLGEGMGDFGLGELGIVGCWGRLILKTAVRS